MEETTKVENTEQVQLKPEQMLEITAGDLGKIYSAYLQMANMLNEIGPLFNNAKLAVKKDEVSAEG